MKIIAIIQGRMGSTRLPGKVMMKINEIPLIELLIRRLSNSKLINQIVLATSEEKNNLILSKNILKSDLKNYKDQIMELDHIVDCKVSRQFPSTINVIVYEREPVALINSDELIILDSEGVCLPVEYCDLSLPILTNFKTNPELYPKGFKTASNNVITSVQLMKYTKDNFSNIYDEISEFVFNEDSEYEFILKNGKTRIMLGTNKLSTKMKYLNSFVKAFDGEKEITDYKYIDLRFKNQVIVKDT